MDNKNTFDDLLEKAFNEYFDRVLAETPSDKELSARYPIPQSSLKKARRKYAAIRRRRSPVLRYIQRAAIIVLISVAVSFIFVMTNSDIKADINKWFLEEHGESVLLIDSENSESETTDGGEDEEDDILFDFEIRYIPDGFELTDKWEISNRDYVYYGPDGKFLTIFITTVNNTAIFIDSDRMKHETIIINGLQAHLAYDYGGGSGIIVFEQEGYIVEVTADTEKEELIKIAENIVLKK